MIWIFLAVALGIITYTSLGTLSVWVVVLTQTIKVLAIVLTGGLLYLAYRMFWRKPS